MTVLKFDLSDVEPGQDFDTPIPKGVYKMKILDIKDAPSKSDGGAMYTVELEVLKGDFKGRRLWDYIKYEDDTSQWKLGQLLEALGVIGKEGKRKGSFNPEKYIDSVVVVRVKHEDDEEYGLQAKVGSMQPLPEGETEEAEPEAEAGEDDAAAEPSGDEPEEVDAAAVRKMDLDELKEFAEEQELEVKFTARSKAEKKADEIIAELELEDAIEDPEDWDALAEMDADSLTAYIEQEELETDTEQEEDDLRVALAEELEIEVPDDAAGGGEAADYDGMSVKDLKATCSERGLETKGGKKGMIKRLKADDAKGSSGSESDPF
jgi:hypothetical protein